MTPLNPERLRRYHQLPRLLQGSHRPDSGMYNITEAIAMVAGEPHNLWPKNLSPTLAGFLNRAGDLAEDQDRQLLIQLIPIVLDTNDPATEAHAAIHLCRTALAQWAPSALRATDWHHMAQQLQEAQDIHDSAAVSARLLEQVLNMKRPHGRKKITAAENLLTICTFYASTIHPLQDSPYETDPEYSGDRAKAHRTAGEMAADILGATARHTRHLDPPHRAYTGQLAVHEVQLMLASKHLSS